MSDAVQSPAEAGPGLDVVCVVASLGGVRAHAALLARLPAHLPAAVVLVQHRPAAAGPDQFTTMLAARTALPVTGLATGSRLRPGMVHVVPGGHTAHIGPDDRVTVSAMAGHRQADPLFASAAALYGPRLIAAVLSGRLDDGALGVRHVKGAGGRVLAQDEVTSQAWGMPSAAIATGCVDFVLPLPVLADAITALVTAPGAASIMRVALPPWARALPPAG